MRKLRCSFCKKSEKEVAKLVAGRGVYICDSCVAIAKQIMDDDSTVVSAAPVRASFWRSLIDRILHTFRSTDVRSPNFSHVLPE
jgi:ATP-dependent protease Clp ATPase subunit